MNATTIIENAKSYNAEYPEAEAMIAEGRPVVWARATAIGTGWRVHLVAMPGIVTPDGGFIAASEPEYTYWTRKAGGRETDGTMARRFATRTYGNEVEVITPYNAR